MQGGKGASPNPEGMLEATGEREEPVTRRYETFQEFWPFYVSQHLHPVCRTLHVAGTTAALGSGVAAIVLSPVWLAAAPVLGYGLAWIGHFVFERNRPAAFRYPFWSLMADLRMWAYVLTGRMRQELPSRGEPR